MSNTAKSSIYQWGAVLSILMAVGFFAVGILVGMDPVERYRGDKFYEVLVANPTIAMTWRPIFAIVGFLGIGVISALFVLVQPNNDKWEGALRWSTLLGYAGSVLLALEWMKEYFGMKIYMQLIQQGRSLPMETLYMVSLPIDADFLWKFGGLGSWYVVVNLLGMRTNVISKGAGWLGVSTGACLLLAMLFGITDTLLTIGGTQIAALQIPSAIGGGLIGPIFHIWIGIALFKEAAKLKPEPSTVAALSMGNVRTAPSN